ncbi:MAG: hypothetical protein A2137_00175 [Chloroflexi bacterium RBG_16_58_8]|nr:MAG: hypothetical protein A2137_00175 [Chloroflexi bacterium RBG_16_58_8]
MNVLTRVFKAALDEANKPESYVKGDEFERFVMERLFPREEYNLLHKTHDYSSNRDNFIASSKLPDFKFVSVANRLQFYVEAKFRSKYHNGVLEWCKPFQLKRYRDINNIVPVLIVVGLGGKPGRPEQVFLIPMQHIQFVKLFPSFLKRYEIPVNRCVSESYLTRIM